MKKNYTKLYFELFKDYINYEYRFVEVGNKMAPLTTREGELHRRFKFCLYSLFKELGAKPKYEQGYAGGVADVCGISQDGTILIGEAGKYNDRDFKLLLSFWDAKLSNEKIAVYHLEYNQNLHIFTPTDFSYTQSFHQFYEEVNEAMMKLWKRGR